MTLAIPRVFHWIWFGDKPLPEQHRAWIDGWLELHPGWKHVLWTDANRPTLRHRVGRSPGPKHDAKWADYPADNADAIAAISRARAGGARFVVVPRPMAYWLEIYPGLAEYLRTRATVRLDNDRTLIVELGEK